MKINWKPPKHWTKITSIEAHTAGEPLRIFLSGIPKVRAHSLLDYRRKFREKYDHLRTATMWEPRGHADMYGAILIKPRTENADFGVFFIHNEGYSTMCGHAIIALTKVVIEGGMIEKSPEDPIIRIDTPAGPVVSKAIFEGDNVVSASFLNVPSFVYMENETVKVDGLGDIPFSIAYGGAFYAIVDGDALGLPLDKSGYSQLINYGKRIKHAIMDQFEIKHPYEEDLGFLYGTIFTGKAHNPENHSRNVCVFAQGEVDRSPTGTGVSARAALHYAKGDIDIQENIRIESILGTTFDVSVYQETSFGKYDAVIPQVSGSASIIGKYTFYIDPEDPLKNGFIFR